MSSTVAAWSRVMATLQGARANALRAMNCTAQTQERELAAILKAGERFQGIRTIDEFRDTVTPQTYEDLQPSLLRQPALAFERTGGSTAGPKLIPYTADGLAAIGRAVHAWLEDLFLHRPSIREGRSYWSISPVMRALETTPNGIPIGLPSDAAYLGPELASAIAPLLVLPQPSTSIDEWRAATLAAWRREPALTLISVWSPTFLLELLRDVDDDILPHLDTISCWTSGPSAVFAEQLRRRFPNVFLQGKGLLATEGVVTIPLCDAPYPVLAVESGFYEFLDAAGRSRLATELSENSTYEILLTTHSGLYRYKLGDRVLMRGEFEGAPMLEFLGRTGVYSDLVGEKLAEPFVQPLLDRIAGFRLLAPTTEPHPHYVLYLDSSEYDDSAAGNCAQQLDEALRSNPQYDYARRLGQLSPVAPVRIPRALQRYYEMACAGGRTLGDVKPPGFVHEHWALSVRSGE